MRNLIKKILKEEVHKDYDMVRKGIDILISLLKKTYPFIVGWKSDKEDINSSEWWIDIHLVISASKAKEYYNMEYKDFYIHYPDELEEIFNAPNKTFHDYKNKIGLIGFGSKIMTILGLEKRLFRRLRWFKKR
jgi:hypothetical protein